MLVKSIIFIASSLLIFVIYCDFTQASRILFAAPHSTKSHHGMIVPLVIELARRGHHVTLINNYATNSLKQVENVTTIIIDELAIDMAQFPTFDDLIAPSLMRKLRLSYATIVTIKNNPIRTAQLTFSDTRVIDLINNHQFDLVIISEANPFVGYALAWHFEAPFILMSPNTLIPGRAESLGDDEHYSYYPVFSTDYSDKMTLPQRIHNFAIGKVFEWIHSIGRGSEIRSIAQQKALPNCPSLDEIVKNISLVFTYTHPTFTYPVALAPKIIEIGGLHCRPAKPLTAVILFIIVRMKINIQFILYIF
jgi:glucuronosyltransferase